MRVETTSPTVVAPPDVTAIVTGALTGVDLRPELASAADLVDGELKPSPDMEGPFPVGVTLVTWVLRTARATPVSTCSAWR